MRTTTFDLSPLFRSSIGFDRVFDLLENSSRVPSVDNWPPYDIVKTGDDSYRIDMAVAGFSKDEITITHEPNLLVVGGAIAAESGPQEYLHQGITNRAFERRFELADHVKVTEAALSDGMLTIALVRELPEEMKPRRIAIAGGGARQQIEADKKPAGKAA